MDKNYEKSREMPQFKSKNIKQQFNIIYKILITIKKHFRAAEIDDLVYMFISQQRIGCKKLK